MDIAVIELKRSVQTDCWKIRAVCLDDRNSLDPPFSGYDCIYAGWGGPSDYLTYCDAPQSDLIFALWSIFRYKGNPKICQLIEGDSGGPFVCSKGSQWSLCGICRGVSLVHSTFLNPLVFWDFIEGTIQSK